MWCICFSLKWKFYIFISPPACPHQYHARPICASFLRQDEDGSLYLTTRYFSYSNFSPSAFSLAHSFVYFIFIYILLLNIIWAVEAPVQARFEISSGQDAFFLSFTFFSSSSQRIILLNGRIKKETTSFDTNKHHLFELNNY